MDHTKPETLKYDPSSLTPVQYLCYRTDSRSPFVDTMNTTKGDWSLPNNVGDRCMYVYPGGKNACIPVDKLDKLFVIVES